MSEKKDQPNNKQLWTIMLAVLGIALFIFIMYLVANIDTTESEEMIEDKVEEVERKPVTSELVIIHKNSTAKVSLFDLQIELVQHDVAVNDSINSKLKISTLSSAELIDELSFTSLDEGQDIPGYNIQIVSTTELAAQVLISKID
ncbi:MAG: hypothetical protein Q8P90_01370 [bacterium]|nr:hypothetical protein [bacterium]